MASTSRPVPQTDYISTCVVYYLYYDMMWYGYNAYRAHIVLIRTQSARKFGYKRNYTYKYISQTRSFRFCRFAGLIWVWVRVERDGCVELHKNVRPALVVNRMAKMRSVLCFVGYIRVVEPIFEVAACGRLNLRLEFSFECDWGDQYDTNQVFSQKEMITVYSNERKKKFVLIKRCGRI